MLDQLNYPYSAYLKELWSRKLESNQRPTDYKSVALPTELFRLVYQNLPVAEVIQRLTDYPASAGLYQLSYFGLFYGNFAIYKELPLFLGRQR